LLGKRRTRLVATVGIGVRAESALVRTHGQHERAVGSPVHHGGPTTGSWAQSSPGAHDYPSAMLVPAFIPHRCCAWLSCRMAPVRNTQLGAVSSPSWRS
jgi:hypothetical protein